MVRARHVTPQNEAGLHTCTAFLMISGPETVPKRGTEEGREEGKKGSTFGKLFQVLRMNAALGNGER